VYWIIVADTEENRQYFANLQDKLESLFKQESILIYFTPVLNLLSDRKDNDPNLCSGLATEKT
jgi:hypothetical protein